jgi:hypothetical protein
MVSAVFVGTLHTLYAVYNRPELKLVGDKPGLEAQLAEAEAESRGWFEDEEVIAALQL